MFSFFAGDLSRKSTSGMNKKVFDKYKKDVGAHCVPLPVTVANATPGLWSGTAIVCSAPASDHLPQTLPLTLVPVTVQVHARRRWPPTPDPRARHRAGAREKEKAAERLEAEETACLEVIDEYLRCNPYVVGSIVMEIVNAATGVVLSPTFCRQLQLICERHLVILICDECLTMGRNGFLTCRTEEYIDFAPDVIVLGKIGFGLTMVKDWSGSRQKINLNERARPTSSQTAYVECSTVQKGNVRDLNAVRKSPAVPDHTFAPYVEEILAYIEEEHIVLDWVRIKGPGGKNKMWWQGSSAGLKERCDHVGRHIRSQLADSFVNQKIRSAHCWGMGTMLWCTHPILTRVFKPSGRGHWKHAQTANIGGMGVRALIASDVPLHVEGVSLKEGGLEFAAGKEAYWAPHVGLVPMLDGIRSISTAVLAHMVTKSVDAQGGTSRQDSDSDEGNQGRLGNVPYGFLQADRRFAPDSDSDSGDVRRAHAKRTRTQK